MTPESNPAQDRLNLYVFKFFPYQVKVLGLMILLIFVVASACQLLHLFDLTEAQSKQFKLIGMYVLTGSLFLIGWSKDKIETEALNLLRMKSLTFAFSINSLFILIVDPLTSLLLKLPFRSLMEENFLLKVLMWHVILYFLGKKNFIRKAIMRQ